jgi:predicted ribosomally synthesized peptide with nif11-like leader
MAMSEEQLTALLAKLKDDAGLQEKLKGAADHDAVAAIAKEAGFDISKAAWLKYQAKQVIELNDEELEELAGGNLGAPVLNGGCILRKTYRCEIGKVANLFGLNVKTGC